MILLIKKKNLIYIIITLLILLFIIQINFSSVKTILHSSGSSFKTLIIIDPGHGGRDPGASSKDGIEEKHINLKIAMKLKDILEKDEFEVLLTRDKDILLSSPGVRNRKASDISNRRKLVNQKSPFAFISIHLNSFSQSKYYGAQTFYTTVNDKSRILAEIIQNELINQVDNTNNRKAKPTKNISLLKGIKVPGVVVECGFLSNTREAKLLKTDEYQNKIAEAITIALKKFSQQIIKENR